jgi:hypothetical protein
MKKLKEKLDFKINCNMLNNASKHEYSSFADANPSS